MFGCPPMITEVFNKRYQSQKSLQTLQLLSDFWKLWLFVITNKYPDRKRRFYLFKIPTSYDSEKISIVMSGHETCKYGKKIERKNSWARECIFSSHRPQKSMKNKRINIKEEKFRILLENWSRYRSEEISPGVHLFEKASKEQFIKSHKHLYLWIIFFKPCESLYNCSFWCSILIL